MYGYGHFYIKNSMEDKCVMMQNKEEKCVMMQNKLIECGFFSCLGYEIKLGNTETMRVGITSPVWIVRE